jgi:hypothetical protein
MATRHSNLGAVLVDLVDLAGAGTDHERALEIDQATLRPNHPTMATFRDNLDHALRQLGGDERKGERYTNAQLDNACGPTTARQATARKALFAATANAHPIAAPDAGSVRLACREELQGPGASGSWACSTG